MSSLDVGTVASVEVVVDDMHLATELAEEAGESFPAVFSTPWLLAQMERAAAKALRPLLSGDQLSVGASATLHHTAPTARGVTIRAYARYSGVDNQLYQFEVWAEDNAGIVGKGVHARAIVPRAAVEKAAQKRLSTIAMKP